MKWSPYVQYRCGLTADGWAKLTPEEQHAVFYAKSKGRDASDGKEKYMPTPMSIVVREVDAETWAKFLETGESRWLVEGTGQHDGEHGEQD